MKIVILYGSPRKGDTYEIVDKIKSQLNVLSTDNLEFDEVFLADLDYGFCKGCYNCFEFGEDKCPHYKQINPIVDKIKACDGLIVTSPVYVLHITALLKNFFDHMAYFYHRPYFFTKKALAVSSTGGVGVKDVLSYIEEDLENMGFNKVYKIGLTMARRDDEKLEKEIKKVSKTFYDDIASGKTHSPSFKRLIMFNVWRAMNSQSTALKADYEYWESTGLKYCDFSPDVKLPLIKKAYAKLLHSILSRVF